MTAHRTDPPDAAGAPSGVDPLSRRDPEAALEALRDHARQAGLDIPALEPLWGEFLALLGRYAALEIRLLGSVPLQFPAYMYEQPDGAPTNPLKEGVELARRERERMDLGSGALDDPIGFIEQQGVKVIQLPFPAEEPLLGAFLFDATTGPAILVDGARPRHEREYAAVHFYGHFLADYDPYRTWVCRHLDGEDVSEETRARMFASAFLVPPTDLALYLAESGVRLPEHLTGEILRGLRVYFDADDRALFGTLLSGGWLTSDRMAGLLVEAGPASGGRATPEDSAPAPRLPGRLVGMAVAAHRSGALSLSDLARTLDMDEAAALLIERTLSLGETGGGDAGRAT